MRTVSHIQARQPHCYCHAGTVRLGPAWKSVSIAHIQAPQSLPAPTGTGSGDTNERADGDLKKVDLMGGKETFGEKTKRLRGASPFGSLTGVCFSYVTGGPAWKCLVSSHSRARTHSVWGYGAGWRVDGLIAKSNDDLRQEQFVMQLLIYYQIAFQSARVRPIWPSICLALI